MRGVGLEFMKKLSDSIFGQGGNDMPEDEQIVEEITFFCVFQHVLYGLDTVQGPINQDFMFCHIQQLLQESVHTIALKYGLTTFQVIARLREAFAVQFYIFVWAFQVDLCFMSDLARQSEADHMEESFFPIAILGRFDLLFPTKRKNFAKTYHNGKDKIFRRCKRAGGGHIMYSE